MNIEIIKILCDIWTFKVYDDDYSLQVLVKKFLRWKAPIKKKNTDKGYHNRMNIFKIIYNHNVCALKWLKTQNATCILARHLQVLGNALLVTEEQKKIRWHLSCTLKVWMVGTWKEICMSTCVWEKDHSYVEFQFVHLPSILSKSMNCIS